MKNKKQKLLVSVVAVMLAINCTMAPVNAFSLGNAGSGFKDWISDIWNKWTGKNDNKGDDVKLTLVEDETTVANGDLLRASTYNVEGREAVDAIKYFPITMFDYDQVKYNEVLKKQEFTPELSQWNGMYMGNGNGSYTYEEKVIYGGEVDGVTVHYEKATTIESGAKYVLVSACEGANGYDKNGIYVGVSINDQNQVISVLNHQNGVYGNPITGATVWTVSESGNAYTFKNSNGDFLTIGEGVSVSRNSQNITVGRYTGKNTDPDYKDTFVLSNETKYINKDGGFNHKVGAKFAIYGNSASDGNAFYLYKVVPGVKEVSNEVTKKIDFSKHNNWTYYTKGEDGKFDGNHIYQGLAKNTLDANGQIQFNNLDAGLFTEKEIKYDKDTYAKKVYTNVGLPFEFDNSKQRYSFNAKKMGAWFSGEAKSNTNLYYSEIPQAIRAGQDDNAAGWFPFDDSTNTKITSIKGDSHSEAIDAKDVTTQPNHYFGMAASIDFTMTQDGKLKDGTPIDFHFSGDDDVWVFIDGKLVLDMGGIHNRIDGDINFADGIWNIKQTYKSKEQAEDINNGTENTKGNLWETLGTDLKTFAAKETHTLTVFYLERGAGASNCEITFNLPMKDYVNVTKDATKDSQGTSLSESEQEIVNKMEFEYTIYCNDQPYANEVYTLLNATTGTVIDTAHTNSEGKFKIKNNETARFTTSFSTNGEKWRVVESDPGEAFVNDETKWSSTAITIDGTKNGSSKGLVSNEVEVTGSEEASGKINYICENILNAAIPNPGIVTSDDRIVLDYGLPVEINVKSNDLFRGDKYEIVGINGTIYNKGKDFRDGINENGVYPTDFGNIKITDVENGLLEYKLNKQLTDVEIITYVVKITDREENGVGTEVKDYIYAEGTIYIIPATSMYYEENFKNADGTNMIVYKDEWSVVGTEDNEYQEPGVVKTPGDSPYGSDIAYLNDTGDSNGTSMFVDSEKTANAFKYTFTGTGTSFFARTSNDSAYLRVTVKDEANETVDQVVIDTRFRNDANKSLKNIPVYTLDNLDYGTYTVTVNIARKTLNYGTKFWLDGIRIQNPMNPDSNEYGIAETAYSDDGEANVNIVTLRDKLIDAAGHDNDGNLVWEDGFAVLTDINGNITSASDYESFGPKQEVYLAGADAVSGLSNGQKISFTLQEWDMDHKLYLGLKAPMGKAVVKIKGHELEINNTPDCYYNISDFVTVDADDNAKIEIEAVSGVVSITNIKTTGAIKFEIIPGEDINEK